MGNYQHNMSEETFVYRGDCYDVETNDIVLRTIMYYLGMLWVGFIIVTMCKLLKARRVNNESES